MLTIYKYALPLQGLCLLNLPAGKILSVRNQNDRLYLWAEVDITKHAVGRKILVSLTGGNLPNCNKTFIGTVLFDLGGYVVHVYEIHD